MYESEGSSWPNQALSQFVAAGGVRWHVQTAGSGPPLLLIHGTGASTHSWRDIIPILARHYTVLAVDLPGHGLTDVVEPRRSTIHGMSDLLLELLGALSFKPVYCVGHSAGAVILCRMTLTRRVAPRVIISINGAFVPLGGFAGMLFSPIAKLLANSGYLQRMLARRAADPANVARVLAGTGSRLDAAGVEFYWRLVTQPKHLAGTLRMMGNWDLHAFKRELPYLTTPLVLMAAANDRTVPPRQAQTVQGWLRNAAVLSLPGVGHLAHEEQPVQLATRIIQVCQAHAGGA